MSPLKHPQPQAPQQALTQAPQRGCDSAQIQVVKLLPEAQLPTHATAGAAGWDLYAAEDLTLMPGQRGLVRTGLALALPPGVELQVRPRSGLALTHGVTVLNAPGTVDSDYRGELRVLLINLGDAPFAISPGMRVAQAVVARYVEQRWVLAQSLPDSDRGAGGFGHSGA
jgi:dUTP pyrophosphatase